MTRRNSEEWEPCPAGELQRLAGKLRRRQQRRVFLGSTAAAVTAASVGSFSWWLWNRNTEIPVPPGEMNFGGIVCSRVRQLADEYKRGELDAVQKDKILVHLSLCPPCNAFYKARNLSVPPLQSSGSA